MKLIKYIVGLILMVAVSVSCQKEDTLTPSGEELFSSRPNTALDQSLYRIFGPYNTILEYRYIESLIPSNWYYITPVKEESVLDIAEFLRDFWILPLEDGSSGEFVKAHFPRMIVIVGSPARKKDGSVVLGEAEGGTLIRFTEMDDFDRSNKSWIRRQMHTAFHEYAHLLHQTFNMPNEFRQITPNEYTLNGWQTVSVTQARTKGMVSPYGTSAVSEDFAELFSFYITETDEVLYTYFIDVEGEVQLNMGRQILRTKLQILNRFLLGIGVDLEAVRISFQTKLNG